MWGVGSKAAWPVPGEAAPPQSARLGKGAAPQPVPRPGRLACQPCSDVTAARRTASCVQPTTFRRSSCSIGLTKCTPVPVGRLGPRRERRGHVPREVCTAIGRDPPPPHTQYPPLGTSRCALDGFLTARHQKARAVDMYVLWRRRKRLGREEPAVSV